MKQPEDRSREVIEFPLDAEVRLKDIVFRADLDPLLAAFISAGASGVSLMDNHGVVLKSRGNAAEGLPVNRPLFYEGEEIGSISCRFPQDISHAAAVAGMAEACMQSLIISTAKRLITTALHTTVVNLSYAELLESNEKLRASEEKYRTLAGSLEQKVNERTTELRAAHARMLQQEKMASIGQLAAGIAHEINNPMGFITSNLNTFDGYMQRLAELVRYCRDSGLFTAEAAELYRRLKISFILEDTPELINQSREGAERVKRIVANLKGFSHIDDAREDYADLNEELDRTIHVLEHESRDRITYIRHYGVLPKYLCNPGMLCQVFLNIIQNSIQASELPTQIMINTSESDGIITVRIADDGPGIPEEVLGRIFEPFFTTKDVGKGTGLGLSIAYDIVKNHGGEIYASSVAGEGAAFSIRLPLRGNKSV